MKIDIMKAYDSVSWNLILDILEAFHICLSDIRTGLPHASLLLSSLS